MSLLPKEVSLISAESGAAPSVDLTRRQALGNIGILGLLGATSGLISCGGNSSSNNSGGSSSSTSSTNGASCVLIPSETIGPFPLSTFLDNSSVLRENIAEDKTGVPLQVNIKLVNVNNNCQPVSGYVYIWHCDKDGYYSGYSETNNEGQAGKTYCRGIQFTDTNGIARFTTIYPGWYPGRISHIHFQIFLTSFGSSASSTAVSQLAFPLDINTAVYNTSLYAKGQNTTVDNFDDDGSFSDGVEYQLATVTGNVTDGLVAELQVGIAL